MPSTQIDQSFINRITREVNRLLPQMVIDHQRVTKNNGITLNAITIGKPNSSVRPAFYIENYTNTYPMGINESAETEEAIRVANEIVNDYNKTQSNEDECKDIVNILYDFEKVKPLLRAKLINKKRNLSRLNTTPYESFIDMIIIAYVEFKQFGNDTATVTVTRDMIRAWNTTFDEVIQIAKANTFNETHTFKSMKEVIAEIMGIPVEEMDDDNEVSMYVLANISQTNGAIKICDTNAMMGIANKLNADLLVLPSSIHEVIIIPKNDDTDIDYLSSMVDSINGDVVDEQDVLSDHVYVFTRKNGWM